MTFLKLYEGFMPLQAIVEVAVCLLIFIALNHCLHQAGRGFSKFGSTVIVALFILWYLNYRIYPPLPFSIRLMYGIPVLCGLFLWVSSSQAIWEEYTRPVINVLDGITLGHSIIRSGVFILLPILLSAFVWSTLQPVYQEPIELRYIHPAPPAETRVHNQTFTLVETVNPFRMNPQGEYDLGYSEQFTLSQEDSRIIEDVNDPEQNPWNPYAKGYMKWVKEGGEIYFQNCHFCHGANLNARGIWAYSRKLKPLPLYKNTIGQLQESYTFWRVAHGGPGLDPGAFPWASVMPPWEEHLSIDDMWKVVLFEYWHSGNIPRTWD